MKFTDITPAKSVALRVVELQSEQLIQTRAILEVIMEYYHSDIPLSTIIPTKLEEVLREVKKIETKIKEVIYE